MNILLSWCWFFLYATILLSQAFGFIHIPWFWAYFPCIFSLLTSVIISLTVKAAKEKVDMSKCKSPKGIN